YAGEAELAGDVLERLRQQRARGTAAEAASMGLPEQLAADTHRVGGTGAVGAIFSRERGGNAESPTRVHDFVGVDPVWIGHEAHAARHALLDFLERIAQFTQHLRARLVRERRVRDAVAAELDAMLRHLLALFPAQTVAVVVGRLAGAVGGLKLLGDIEKAP